LGNIFLVHTSRGIIECDVVVHATNAWASDLLPLIKPFITPVRNHVIQTTELQHYNFSTNNSNNSNNTVEDSECINSTKTRTSESTPLNLLGYSIGFHDGYDYLIQRQNSRMILGGIRYLAPNMDINISDINEPFLPFIIKSLQAFIPAMFPIILDKLNSSFNTISPIKISHVWSGIMGFTFDSEPIVGMLRKPSDNVYVSDNEHFYNGQFILAGFSGHGIPRCPFAAEIVSNKIEIYLKLKNEKPKKLFNDNNNIIEILESLRVLILKKSPIPLSNHVSDSVLSNVGLTREKLLQIQNHNYYYYNNTSKL